MYEILDNKEEYISDLIEIDKDLYKDEYLWTVDKQLSLFRKNNNSFVIIGYNNKPVGYINYLSITKEKYDEMKNANKIIDDFIPDDILPFTNNHYLTINSVCVKEEHQNKEVITIITDNFLKNLIELKNNGINILGINGIAVSDGGRKFLTNLGFIETRKLDDGNYLYLIEDNVIETIKKNIIKLKDKKKRL